MLTTRLLIFISCLTLFTVLETFFPKKKNLRPQRWLNNLIVATLSALTLKLFFFVGGVKSALFAKQYSLGLLHWIHLPAIFNIIIAMLVLDCLIYWQHRLMHRWPLLWRLHQVHHADNMLDASTGIRFHPLEALLSMCIRSVAILLFGIPVTAVVLFEIILNGTSLFNHANLTLPKTVDKILRLFIVTPDMHRIHHTVKIFDQHHNFSFSISLWDRLFHSYLGSTQEDDIGLSYVLSHKAGELFYILRMPFRSYPAEGTEYQHE